MIKASIVVITRNRCNSLKKCLDSLIKNVGFYPEIIIVDNYSQDNTFQMLRGFKNLVVLKNRKNMGPVAARNTGISKARGEFIIFVDDDVYIKDNNFLQIIEFMEKRKKVGIVGPKILYPNETVQESARAFPTLLSVLWRGTFLHRMFPSVWFYKDYIMGDFDHSGKREVDWVLGACQVVRKEVFDSIGKFDEGYFMYYGEDIDFCYRAKNAGWKVIYYPYSKVYHHYARESAKGLINRLKVEHVKSIIRFFYKKNFAKF